MRFSSGSLIEGMNMKTCDYCKQYSDFSAYKLGNKIFCSKDCAKKVLFCRYCLGTTKEISNSGWQKYLWDWASEKRKGFEFGPAFGSSHEKACPRCGSTVQRLWICFFFPIIPLQKYRILAVEKEGKLNWSFIVRKLKNL